MRQIRFPVRLLFLTAVGATWSLEARADVPPPDGCTMEGSACDNAGTTADQPGTCTMSTCTRATPDGSMEYDCLRCLEGGAGGAGGTGGGATGGAAGTTTGTGGTSTAPPSPEEDDGGCSIAVQAPVGAAGFGVMAGLAALVVARRRRR